MNNIAGVIAELKTFKCPQHGEYKHAAEESKFWAHCPKCIEFEERIKREDREKLEDEHRRHRVSSCMKNSGIPERFIAKTLDAYEAKSDGQKRALGFALEYASTFDRVSDTGRSAIFCGKPGTGKTHLAIGIALHVINTGKPAVFETVQRLMRRIKESWRKDATETETAVMEAMTSPALLIIDEIGVQFGSEFEKNAMFDILNERYEKRRPTLLLSNLTAQEVKAFLGERIYDRLKEDGGQCVSFDWASHRGKA